jgi:glycosyltransferase involved in cell wall biosynthesis
MRKIVLIDSSYPINTRNDKIINSLNESENYVIAWNRDNREYKPIKSYIEFIYYSKAQYGKFFSKLFKLIFYASFIKKTIKTIKPDFIIASHWDTLIIASLVKSAHSKLIYENLDMPSAGNNIVLKILQKVERIALKKTDIIIFASRFFVPHYTFFKKEKYVLENKPLRAILADQPVKYTHESDNLKVSFVGTLRYFDCMKNLISVARGLPVDILFFGDGPDYARLSEFAQGMDNVCFLGRYGYEDIKCIYELSDVIWAVYPNKDFNVKYAISNKFFESLIFKKPAFYADNTDLGNFVSKNNIGFTVDPYNALSIRKKLEEISSNKTILLEMTREIQKYNACNSLFWDDDVKILREIFPINS